MPRFAAAAALVLATAACAAAAARPSDQSLSEVRLPRTFPQELTLATDSSLWMTDEYGGVTRRAPSGRLKAFSLGQDVYASDVTVDTSGTAWVAGFEREARIAPDGHVATWPTAKGGDADAVTSAGADAWFAVDGSPGRIEHRRADGSVAAFPLSGARRAASLAGIALAPDGALWFTQSGGYSRQPPDGIGRMTAGGAYRSWRLPHRRADPVRITAGPDGALWFTERDEHAIGRITASGAITELPLATGLSPYDIKAGPDGALWFTADSCIGRITTEGAVTAWPVRGAGRLLGIAPAPDGSIWAADDLKSALWHFLRPPADRPLSKPCTPPTVTHRARSTSASLTYRRENTFGSADWFTDARIRISRRGRQLFAEQVPRIKGAIVVYGDTSGFAIRDLDGDGEPEVLLLLNWNGAHCCAWSRIYRYVPSRQTYVASTHFWGEDFTPRIRDLDGDGKPEFTAFDDRFAYAFGSFADSSFPIQIWTYRRGVFRDVTRGFPKQIRRDAAAQWRYYERYRRKHYNVRGFLAAWAADEYLLGRGAAVWPTLERLARRGELACSSCWPQQSANAYLRALRRFLRRTGYLR
jgi:streptogramin lyase